GKKVILVNCSGSPIGLEPELESCDAILQAWYPGQAGGTAVADILFGKYNPSARLPVTFYRNVSQLPDFENYDMAGRTYRYLTEKPLFPFGYGLSYTTFTYGKPSLNRKSIKVGENIKLTVPLTNSGKMDGEEVVQLYMRKKGDVDGPTKALRAFTKTHLVAGQTKQVEFDITPKQLEWWDEATQSMLVKSGEYEFLVGSSSDDDSLHKISFRLK
ncbi:glycoside hydrolase family 3 protein, partial [Pseudoxanthomonas sp. SGD-10]